MLTPDDLRTKLQRRYPEFLRTWLTGETIFPLDYPIGKLPTNIVELMTFNDALEADRKRYGYQVEREHRRSKTLGQQDFPTAVNIKTSETFLRMLNKQAEFANFQSDISLIQTLLPALRPWLVDHTVQVIEYHGLWAELIEVCLYFIDNPRSDKFTRELPISSHTKFIENNQRILRSLLDFLLKEHLDPEQRVFAARYGLRTDEPIVRLRLLDNQLKHRFGLELNDLSVPVSQLHAIDLSNNCGLIIENKTTFLTLPPLTNAFAIFGSGFDVNALKEVAWLQKCRLLYWGDLDVQGFEILAMVRRFLPNIESLMMDHETLDTFKGFIVSGTSAIATSYPELTNDEFVLSRSLADRNLRLEQERISLSYANSHLVQAINRN